LAATERALAAHERAMAVFECDFNAVNVPWSLKHERASAAQKNSSPRTSPSRALLWNFLTLIPALDFSDTVASHHWRSVISSGTDEIQVEDLPMVLYGG
jgi:hypothetical protein